METPLVSVIIPCYNHEKYVKEAIESVVQQTYENIELIIINDGSTDNSHKMILGAADVCKDRFKRFRYINKENEGIAKTANVGINLAKGVYISFLASDDIIMSDKIEVLVNEFENLSDNYAVVGGDAQFISGKGNEIYLDEHGVSHLEKKKEFYSSFFAYHTRYRTDFNYKKEFGLYKTFLLGNYIPAMSALIKKQALVNVGLFDEGNFIEDYDIWLKLSKKYKFKYINRSVAYYRLHCNNFSKVSRRKLLVSTAQLFIREKPYCYRNTFKIKWKIGYFNVLLSLLKSEYYTEFFDYFGEINKLDFFVFAMKKIFKYLLKNNGNW